MSESCCSEPELLLPRYSALHRHTEKPFLSYQHLPAPDIWVTCNPQHPHCREKLPMLKEQADFRTHCDVFSGVPETLTTSESPCHQGARLESTDQCSRKWVVPYHLRLHVKQQQVNCSRRGDGKAKQSSTRNYDGRIEKPHQELRKQAAGL